MLFNSFVFIFAYLPIVLAGFFILSRFSKYWPVVWLAIASLFFYGSWDYRYLPLLLLSITCNFYLGRLLHNLRLPRRKTLLIAAVSANLLLLAYFKYANFFVSNVNEIAGREFFLPMHVVLPIGISFFTFTQIAFLVDTYEEKVSEYNFSHYLLFVTYFPHLVAGPVLHHKEMMPQFRSEATYCVSWENIAVGISIFVIGLGKKVLLADNIAVMANPIFEPGSHPGLIEAWVGAIGYSLQLYFDFSGYSDMAIGLSLLFGVRLPLNFNSPYKAANIIDFWRRWHMTLSRFLRDYLYIRMGGSRHGSFARYRNLILTMLLGGLWHGAGWTFVIWGGLHGVYIAINHYWHFLRRKFGWEKDYGDWAGLSGHLLTLLAVLIAWVVFRAPDLATAADVLSGMAGLNGVDLPSWSKEKLAWLVATGAHLRFDGIRWIDFGSAMHLPLLLLGLILVLRFPNSQEIVGGLEARSIPSHSTAQRNALSLRMDWVWVSFISILFLACVFSLNRATEFLYFQF